MAHALAAIALANTFGGASASPTCNASLSLVQRLAAKLDARLQPGEVETEEGHGLHAEFFNFEQTCNMPDFTNRIPDQVRIDPNINYGATSDAWSGMHIPSDFQDHFAARWTGALKIKTAGDYTFYTNSDDGSVVLLGNDRVVNNDGCHAMELKSGTRQLASGFHAIEIQFFENGGGAGMEFFYQGPDTGGERVIVPTAVLFSTAPTPSPTPAPTREPTAPTPPTPAGTGLLAAFYNFEQGCNMPDFEARTADQWRIDPLINYQSSLTAWEGFDVPDDFVDHFAVRWTGAIKIDYAGQYEFYTTSDDGSFVMLDDELVVDNDGCHAMETKSGKKELESGYHPIVVSYFENGGHAGMQLFYKGPDTDGHPIIVPTEVLYPPETPAPTPPTPAPTPPPPTPFPAPPYAVLTAGWSHTCAIQKDGEAMCWGYGYYGQLGGGFGERNLSPMDLKETLPLGDGVKVTQIAAGHFHTCALINDGAVKCWGFNGAGQLGLGMSSDTQKASDMGNNLPTVDLGSGMKAVQVIAWNRNSCVRLGNGQVKCWGYNSKGILGQGVAFSQKYTLGDSASDMGDSLPAINLGSGRIAVDISISSTHACVVLEEGKVKCWGLNTAGQLGLEYKHGVFDANIGEKASDMGDNLLPAKLGDGTFATSVAAGNMFTCAILGDGAVQCWGRNRNSMCGQDVSISEVLTPTNVNLGDNAHASQLVTGDHFTCVRLTDGVVKCWGYNGQGQVAGGAKIQTDAYPVDLGKDRIAVEITAGVEHACARLLDGGIKCWGNGGNYRLGLANGQCSNRGEPGDFGQDMGDKLPPIKFRKDPVGFCFDLYPSMDPWSQDTRCLAECNPENTRYGCYCNACRRCDYCNAPRCMAHCSDEETPPWTIREKQKGLCYTEACKTCDGCPNQR